MFMAVAGSFVGASSTRRSLKGWSVTANSADEDTVDDLETLRARSRDMARNTPLATGAIGTVVQNVVGTGLTLQAKPDWEAVGRNVSAEEADAWTAQVEREFRLWAEGTDCDLTRTQNFYGLQGLVFRSALESGDVFVTLPMVGPANPYELRVQVVEADRVESPTGLKEIKGNKVISGVEKDANGAPVAYHILRNHPGSTEGIKREFDRIPAFGKDFGGRRGRRNVLHIFERTRPGQTRGVPYLAPVIEPLKQLDKYTESELMAAVVASLLTVFVKSESGDGFAPPAGEQASDAEVKLGTGTIVDLAPGEDITTVAPNRPNTAFDPFTQAILRQIGVALGLPFEVLIKHFTASYSAARAALLEAWRFFRLRREFLAQMFCAPVYEAWLEEAIARGRVDAPGFFDDPAIRRAYLQAEWIGDSPGQIDPVKEVQAAEKRLQIGVSTLADETLLLTGKVWEDQHRQQVKERQMRERDGLLGSSPGTDREQNQAGREQEREPERGDDIEKEERD